MIESNKRDVFGRSLTYTKKQRGPGIITWGTPQVTYLRCVWLFSSI